MTIPTDGLELYLPLYSVDMQDSSLTSKDENKHSVSVVGAVWGNKGLVFDGTTTYCKIPDADSLDITGGLTLGAWVKPDLLEINRLICKSADDGSWSPPYVAYELIISSTTGKVNFAINKGGDYTILTSSATLTASIWTLVMGINDTSALSIYFNASLDITATTGGTINTTSGSLFLGSRAPAPINLLDGTIGEAEIWSHALTASERTAFHNDTVKTYKACWGFFTWK